MMFTEPSLLYRSSRGPRMAAAVSPAIPPMPWTIIPPAKSAKGVPTSCSTSPVSGAAQVNAVTIGYMTAASRNV